MRATRSKQPRPGEPTSLNARPAESDLSKNWTSRFGRIHSAAFRRPVRQPTGTRSQPLAEARLRIRAVRGGVERALAESLELRSAPSRIVERWASSYLSPNGAR